MTTIRRGYSVTGIVRNVFVGVSIVFLLASLHSCNAFNDYGVDKSAFVPNGALPENREQITLQEAVGSYTGNITLTMDGKQYGPYNETVTIGKALDRYFFNSQKVVYGNTMPVDIRYYFNSITLTPAADGTSIAFSGTNGVVYYIGKAAQPNDLGLEAGRKTKISGTLFKINGKVYITYTTVYDTAEMKEFIPLLKKLPGHNDMSGTAAKSAKQ